MSLPRWCCCGDRRYAAATPIEEPCRLPSPPALAKLPNPRAARADPVPPSHPSGPPSPALATRVAGPANEKVELDELVVEESDSDDEFEPTGKVKGSGPLKAVTSRIRQHLSQDSLHQQTLTEEQIARRAELKRLMHRRIQEELQSEGDQESYTDSSPQSRTKDYLPRGGPRDNLEFSMVIEVPETPETQDGSQAAPESGPDVAHGTTSPEPCVPEPALSRRASWPKGHQDSPRASQLTTHFVLRERSSLPQMPPSPVLAPLRLSAAHDASSIISWRLSIVPRSLCTKASSPSCQSQLLSASVFGHSPLDLWLKSQNLGLPFRTPSSERLRYHGIPVYTPTVKSPLKRHRSSQDLEYQHVSAQDRSTPVSPSRANSSPRTKARFAALSIPHRSASIGAVGRKDPAICRTDTGKHSFPSSRSPSGLTRRDSHESSSIVIVNPKAHVSRTPAAPTSTSSMSAGSFQQKYDHQHPASSFSDTSSLRRREAEPNLRKRFGALEKDNARTVVSKFREVFDSPEAEPPVKHSLLDRWHLVLPKAVRLFRSFDGTVSEQELNGPSRPRGRAQSASDQPGSSSGMEFRVDAHVHGTKRGPPERLGEYGPRSSDAARRRPMSLDQTAAPRHDRARVGGIAQEADPDAGTSDMWRRAIRAEVQREVAAHHRKSLSGDSGWFGFHLTEPDYGSNLPSRGTPRSSVSHVPTGPAGGGAYSPKTSHIPKNPERDAPRGPFQQSGRTFENWSFRSREQDTKAKGQRILPSAQETPPSQEPRGTRRGIPESWARFPSYSRAERTGSAGSADNVITKDFADTSMRPDAPWMTDTSSAKSATLPDQRRRSFSSRVGERVRARLSKLIPRRVSSIDKTTIGARRSSVQAAGRLDYPELELLPTEAGYRELQALERELDSMKGDPAPLGSISEQRPAAAGEGRRLSARIAECMRHDGGSDAETPGAKPGTGTAMAALSTLSQATTLQQYPQQGAGYPATSTTTSIERYVTPMSRLSLASRTSSCLEKTAAADGNRESLCDISAAEIETASMERLQLIPPPTLVDASPGGRAAGPARDSAPCPARGRGSWSAVKGAKSMEAIKENIRLSVLHKAKSYDQAGGRAARQGQPVCPGRHGNV